MPHPTCTHQFSCPLMLLAWTNQCCDGCCMVISKLHRFLYVYQLAFHCKEKRSLLSINLHQDGFPSSCVIYWVIICHYFYLFWFFRCPDFGQKGPLWTGSCGLLLGSHYSLGISLFSGTKSWSILILYCFCPNRRLSYFSKESWFLSEDVQIRRSQC